MTAAYPIILTPAPEGGYDVYVPDLDLNTQGRDKADAIYMAADAISLTGLALQDKGKPIPPASDELPACGADELATYALVDFEAYRRANDTRSVRKNVTIPGYLNDLAERAGLSFSQVLQEGLKQRLGVQ